MSMTFKNFVDAFYKFPFAGRERENLMNSICQCLMNSVCQCRCCNCNNPKLAPCFCDNLCGKTKMKCAVCNQIVMITKIENIICNDELENKNTLCDPSRVIDSLDIGMGCACGESVYHITDKNTIKNILYGYTQLMIQHDGPYCMACCQEKKIQVWESKLRQSLNENNDGIECYHWNPLNLRSMFFIVGNGY